MHAPCVTLLLFAYVFAVSGNELVILHKPANIEIANVDSCEGGEVSGALAAMMGIRAVTSCGTVNGDLFHRPSALILMHSEQSLPVIAELTFKLADEQPMINSLDVTHVSPQAFSGFVPNLDSDADLVLIEVHTGDDVQMVSEHAVHLYEGNVLVTLYTGAIVVAEPMVDVLRFKRDVNESMVMPDAADAQFVSTDYSAMFAIIFFTILSLFLVTFVIVATMLGQEDDPDSIIFRMTSGKQKDL